MGETRKREIGTRRVRREDPVLLTGEVHYTDDMLHAPMSGETPAHAAICRSQYGSADIDEIDTSDAERLDGVIAVFTAADLEASGTSGTAVRSGPFPGQQAVEFSLLARDRVRFTGDAIAVVVAEDRYVAHDAVELIDVSYTRREAVTDVQRALEETAPRVHENLENNRLFSFEYGDHAATDTAFADADTVVDVSLRHQRLAPNPLEPRCALGDYDPDSGRLVLYPATQHPHMVQRLVAEMLDLPLDRVRIITPDVGGGFGAKGGFPKAGEVLAGWCSMQLERPVKWVATRTENLKAGPHGRDHHIEASLAVDADGRIRGLRSDFLVNAGAYQIWGHLGGKYFKILMSGAYRIPAISGSVTAVLTNTAPIAPYRGAGRPESIYIVERLVDLAATELGIDPVALRRRNFIPHDEFPAETATGVVYDSGDYERALDVALELADYEQARERQRTLREEGRYLGIGIASFIENTGSPGATEMARVELDAHGQVHAYCGTSGHGQGHDTSFSQLLADELGIPFDSISLHEGDTDELAHGLGTSGSRSATQGGSALVESARVVRANAKAVAAAYLGVPIEQVVFENGIFRVADAPEDTLSIQAAAELAHSTAVTPVDSAGMQATSEFDIANYAFTFGTHVAVVEVDPDTGDVTIERYIAVDDCGTQLNPLIVDGQVHGGIAQGIGEALYEHAVYDDNGTLITGSLQDYTLPKSMQLPEMETASTVTPTPLNPTGAKGIGEGGTIGSTPTVVNAVVDALTPFGITHLEKPVTPESIWRAINAENE